MGEGRIDQEVSPADAASVLDDLAASPGRLNYAERGALRLLLRFARAQDETPEEVRFEPVGEIVEHVAYEGPISATLYGCSVCGAPVVDMAKETHERWHRLVGVWPVTDD